MRSLPTVLPKDPPNYTEFERAYYDGILSSASPNCAYAVSLEMLLALQDYQRWKLDRALILTNLTLEPL